MPVHLEPFSIDQLNLPLLSQKKLNASVLRLDKMHPEISGNKWFKLKEYLAAAEKNNQKTIITFGGAYSNHILATAAACYEKGLQAIGIIRGEEAPNPSPTLQQAKSLGMQFYFVSREAYRLKKIPDSILQQYPDAFVIAEGGYGYLGMKGAKDILPLDKPYTHILAAVGTGTTLAGLIEASAANQQVIGISALKNNFSLAEEINELLSANNKNRFQLLHNYFFGGYAKYNQQLVDFMNAWYEATSIPSDFVYTAKLFYAFEDLVKQDFFPAGSNLLLIHSGGLQGNRSLLKGTLIF